MDLFTFVVAPGVKASICCSEQYARWLVNTGRVVGGVFTCLGNRVYL